MRRFVPLCLLFLLALPAHAREKRAPDGEAAKMAGSMNAFALDFYRALGGTENLFFSPYSISAAVGMTRAGARGETAAEMDRVFHYPGGLARKQGALAKALEPRMLREQDEKGKWKEVPAYALNVANALWAQKGFALLPAFTSAMKDAYGAPVQSVDFRQQKAARKAINDWVEKQTRDKIKDIVPEGAPPPFTRLVLANAIYFKAGWTEPFSKRATKERLWHLPDGSKKQVDLMRDMDGFGYTEDDDVQVAELGYRGGETSMVVILPKEKDGLAALEAKLTGERLTTWLKALRHQEVDLSLPRWKFTWSGELGPRLSRMGMKLAFDPNAADFSGITEEEPLFIGLILHKAFIAVDEEGTEAAAATVIMMPTGAVGPPEQPKRFVADHPFIFLIRHRKTGAILFMGRLVDPTAK